MLFVVILSVSSWGTEGCLALRVAEARATRSSLRRTSGSETHWGRRRTCASLGASVSLSMRLGEWAAARCVPPDEEDGKDSITP